MMACEQNMQCVWLGPLWEAKKIEPLCLYTTEANNTWGSTQLT